MNSADSRRAVSHAGKETWAPISRHPHHRCAGRWDLYARRSTLRAARHDRGATTFAARRILVGLPGTADGRENFAAKQANERLARQQASFSAASSMATNVCGNPRSNGRSASAVWSSLCLWFGLVEASTTITAALYTATRVRLEGPRLSQGAPSGHPTCAGYHGHAGFLKSPHPMPTPRAVRYRSTRKAPTTLRRAEGKVVELPTGRDLGPKAWSGLRFR